MRLDRFDLNLLIAFDILIDEQNVTRAAARLNLTQSAMSAALRRLREAFGDEILVQHGKRMLPTATALALQPEVSDAIHVLRGILSRATRFDPATSQRNFHIVASDYITTVLIAPMLQSLRDTAPGIQLEITLPSHEIQERLDDGDIDLILTPDTFMAGRHPRELLFEEHHVVVGWNENPVMKEPLTLESYLSCGHIAVSVSRYGTFIENHLRDVGDKRRVEIVCAAFSQVPWMLPGTNRLALMHERLARILVPVMPLSIAEPPFKLPPMREMMQYHQARSADPGLSWLREQLMAAVRG